MQLSALQSAQANIQQYIRQSPDGSEQSKMFMAVLSLLTDARQVLFENGQYKGVKWYQFKRVVRLIGLTIDFIKLIVRIF